MTNNYDTSSHNPWRQPANGAGPDFLPPAPPPVRPQITPSLPENKSVAATNQRISRRGFLGLAAAVTAAGALAGTRLADGLFGQSAPPEVPDSHSQPEPKVTPSQPEATPAGIKTAEEFRQAYEQMIGGWIGIATKYCGDELPEKLSSAQDVAFAAQQILTPKATPGTSAPNQSLQVVCRWDKTGEDAFMQPSSDQLTVSLTRFDTQPNGEQATASAEIMIQGVDQPSPDKPWNEVLRRIPDDYMVGQPTTIAARALVPDPNSSLEYVSMNIVIFEGSRIEVVDANDPAQTPGSPGYDLYMQRFDGAAGQVSLGIQELVKKL